MSQANTVHGKYLYDVVRIVFRYVAHCGRLAAHEVEGYGPIVVECDVCYWLVHQLVSVCIGIVQGCCRCNAVVVGALLVGKLVVPAGHAPILERVNLDRVADIVADIVRDEGLFLQRPEMTYHLAGVLVVLGGCFLEEMVLYLEVSVCWNYGHALVVDVVVDPVVVPCDFVLVNVINYQASAKIVLHRVIYNIVIVVQVFQQIVLVAVGIVVDDVCIAAVRDVCQTFDSRWFVQLDWVYPIHVGFFIGGVWGGVETAVQIFACIHQAPVIHAGTLVAGVVKIRKAQHV